MGSLGVVDPVEPIDLLLQLLQTRREWLFVEEAEQGLMEASVLALRRRFIGFAGDRFDTEPGDLPPRCLIASSTDSRVKPSRPPVTTTDMPAIWISHGTTETVTALGFDGHLVDLSMAQLTDGQAMQYLCIRIEIDAEILKRVDIIDTPGISDPRMTTDIVEEVARNVDFVVWCSPMTRAWRQTERAFWKALPAHIKPASILALPRADLIASTRDIDKVVRRCKTESDGSFTAVLPIAAPLATQARAAASAEDRAQLLRESGIPDFGESLVRSIAKAERPAPTGQFWTSRLP